MLYSKQLQSVLYSVAYRFLIKSHIARAERYIVIYSRQEKLVVWILEHDARAPSYIGQRRSSKLYAVYLYAAVRRQHAYHRQYQRAFSSAVCPDKRQMLAVVYIHRYIINGCRAVRIFYSQIFYFYHLYTNYRLNIVLLYFM